MSAALPNRLHLCSGETTIGASFGGLYSITPIDFPANGHTPHVDVRFVGGARFTLTPATFAELLWDGPAALAKLETP